MLDEKKSSLEIAVEDVTNDHGMFDKSAKAFLTVKNVMAFILNCCVPEYKNCSLQEVEGYLNACQESKDADVLETLNPDNGKAVGNTIQDIVFRAKLPDDKSALFDVEAQRGRVREFFARVALYDAHMIQRQMGVVLPDRSVLQSDYSGLTPIFTIWLCRENNITDKPTVIYQKPAEYVDYKGKSPFEGKEPPISYINNIIVAFREVNDLKELPFKNPTCKEEHLLNVLGTSFSSELDKETRLTVLEENGIPVNRTMEGVVTEMVDWGREIAEENFTRGEEKGIIKGLAEGSLKTTVEHVRALVTKLGVSVQQALSTLDVTPDIAKTVEETIDKDEQDADKEEPPLRSDFDGNVWHKEPAKGSVGGIESFVETFGDPDGSRGDRDRDIGR